MNPSLIAIPFREHNRAGHFAHRSPHVDCNHNVSFQSCPLRQWNVFWSQEAGISGQTLISPPPCTLPQEIALLRHAPASASLSGQNPNSGNIFTAHCGYRPVSSKATLSLWRASK